MYRMSFGGLSAARTALGGWRSLDLGSILAARPNLKQEMGLLVEVLRLSHSSLESCDPGRAKENAALTDNLMDRFSEIRYTSVRPDGIAC